MDALTKQLTMLQQQQQLIRQMNLTTATSSPPQTPSQLSASGSSEDGSTTSAKKGTKRSNHHGNVLPPVGYTKPTRIEDMNFSEKLHVILSRPDLESIIEWRPHGRAFKVYVPQLFAIHVCPEYFGHNSYARFRRELNENGFIHIPSGLDQNGYYHEMFLKHRLFLCRHITHAKSKSLAKISLKQHQQLTLPDPVMALIKNHNKSMVVSPSPSPAPNQPSLVLPQNLPATPFEKPALTQMLVDRALQEHQNSQQLHVV
eukprot:scaffold8405_cov169-Amphora_coffeaeformis.AAC.5